MRYVSQELKINYNVGEWEMTEICGQTYSIIQKE